MPRSDRIVVLEKIKVLFDLNSETWSDALSPKTTISKVNGILTHSMCTVHKNTHEKKNIHTRNTQHRLPLAPLSPSNAKTFEWDTDIEKKIYSSNKQAIKNCSAQNEGNKKRIQMKIKINYIESKVFVLCLFARNHKLVEFQAIIKIAMHVHYVSTVGEKQQQQQ